MLTLFLSGRQVPWILVIYHGDYILHCTLKNNRLIEEYMLNI